MVRQVSRIKTNVTGNSVSNLLFASSRLVFLLLRFTPALAQSGVTIFVRINAANPTVAKTTTLRKPARNVPVLDSEGKASVWRRCSTRVFDPGSLGGLEICGLQPLVPCN